jgi:hypothetical protein
MDSQAVVRVDELTEKQKVLNKVLAAGLNSLVSTATYSKGPDKDLLDKFITESFDKVFPCWDMLDDKIKFYVFKLYMPDFENFLKNKIEASNV